jgi:hypothetical protein
MAKRSSMWCPRLRMSRLFQDLRDNPDLVFEDPRELEQEMSFIFTPKCHDDSGITYYALDSRTLQDTVARFDLMEVKLAIHSLRDYVIRKFIKE